MDHLCEACSTIFSEGSLSRYAYDLRVMDLDLEDKIPRSLIWHAHHLSADSHRNALSQGCVPCSWIPIPESEDYGTFFCVKIDVHFARQTPLYTVLLGQPRRMPKGQIQSLVPEIPEVVTIRAVSTYLETIPEQISTLSSISRLQNNTGQPDVLQLAREWLDHCLESHDQCPGLKIPTRPPKRLLALSKTCAKLIDTNNHVVTKPYATLSHCWGGMPGIVLTSHNREILEKGLPFSDFDPTFHDAMLTTRALGIEYLWIDCYCIMQGNDSASLEDWRDQSVLMHEIYANAVINIGAAHGKDSRAGCFQDRVKPIRAVCDIRWQPFLSTPDTCFLRIGNESRIEELRQHFNRCTLHSRAWVLQERLLSQRMLYFGDQQIFWDCRSTPFASETWPSGMSGELSWHNFLHAGGLTGTFGDKVSSRLYPDAIEEYSRCKLSFPDKDKYIAFEGVGRRICELAGTTYCAGFPLSTLPYSLCWTSSRLEETSNEICRDQFTPSWHWACSSGEFRWRDLLVVEKTQVIPLMSLVSGYGPLVESRGRLGVCVCIGKPLWISSLVEPFPRTSWCHLERVAPGKGTRIHSLEVTDEEEFFERGPIDLELDSEEELLPKSKSQRLCLLPVCWQFEPIRSDCGLCHAAVPAPSSEPPCQAKDHNVFGQAHLGDCSGRATDQENVRSGDEIRAKAFRELRSMKISQDFWDKVEITGLVLSENVDGSFRREGTFTCEYLHEHHEGFEEVFEVMQQARAQMIIIR